MGTTMPHYNHLLPLLYGLSSRPHSVFTHPFKRQDVGLLVYKPAAFEIAFNPAHIPAAYNLIAVLDESAPAGALRRIFCHNDLHHIKY